MFNVDIKYKALALIMYQELFIFQLFKLFFLELSTHTNRYNFVQLFTGLLIKVFTCSKKTEPDGTIKSYA
jgi:hypothetical protein